MFPDLPEPEREYRFDTNRRWRFDFAWPQYKLAVELEGGHRIRGRHNRGDGFQADCEKYNAAQLAGWIVLRYTSEHLRDDPWTMVEQIRKGLAAATHGGDSSEE